MKRAILALLVSFVNLSVFYPSGDPLQNFAMVFTKAGFQGSAVYLGDGYFLTATHVLQDSAGRWISPTIVMDGQRRSEVAAHQGDLALVKTTHLKRVDVRFGRPQLRDKVWWVQPLFLDGEPHLLLIEGRVAEVNPDRFFLDRITYPGSSGTGIWNERGELIGIGTGFVGVGRLPVYGYGIPVYRSAMLAELASK